MSTAHWAKRSQKRCIGRFSPKDSGSFWEAITREIDIAWQHGSQEEGKPEKQNVSGQNHWAVEIHRLSDPLWLGREDSGEEGAMGTCLGTLYQRALFFELHILFFWIGVSLLYNVVIVSAEQQCKSAIRIHTTLPSWASLPLRPPTLLDHHRAVSCAPCAVKQPPASCPFYMVVYICQCYALRSSHPLLPLLCPQVHSLCISVPALQIGSSVPFF